MEIALKSETKISTHTHTHTHTHIHMRACKPAQPPSHMQATFPAHMTNERCSSSHQNFMHGFRADAEEGGGDWRGLNWGDPLPMFRFRLAWVGGGFGRECRGSLRAHVWREGWLCWACRRVSGL